MRHTTRHFKSVAENISQVVDIESEVEEVANKKDVRIVLQLTRGAIQIISSAFPLVLNTKGLETLEERLLRLGQAKEFGISPLFSPQLVDFACQHGIFPLSLPLYDNVYAFAPKLHSSRSLTYLNPLVKEGSVSNDNSGEGVFSLVNLHVSKKYLGERGKSGSTGSFDVFINRKDDLAPVLSLIWLQHGENWLCRALRACFVHMFLNKELYRTKVVVIAIRRHCDDVATDVGEKKMKRRVGAFANGDRVEEGDLVAAELGFIVGDIYSSATGAYSSSGAGTLQLAVTGEVMRSVGCTLWDLGMAMEYKNKTLNCVSLTRKQWLQLVRQHVADPTVVEGIEGQLLERFSHGVSVRQFFVKSSD